MTSVNRIPLRYWTDAGRSTCPSTLTAFEYVARTPGDAQQVTGTQARGARLRVGQIHVHHDALAPLVDALERRETGIRLGRQAPAKYSRSAASLSPFSS